MTRYSRSAWQVIAVAAFAATAALAVVLTRPQLTGPSALTSAATCRAPGLDTWLGVGADPGVASASSREEAAQAQAAQAQDSQTRTGQAGASAATTASTDAFYTLEFTNVSGQACSLNGYPSVWAYTGGQQIGSPATPDTSVRPSTVTLAPHATAHAVLRYTLTARSGTAACREVTVRELRVYLPHAGGSVVVPLTILVCSRRGPGFLTVQAVQPQAGIPGFPRY